MNSKLAIGLIATVFTCLLAGGFSTSSLAMEMETKGKTCFDGERYWNIRADESCPTAGPRRESPGYRSAPKTDWRAVLENLKTKRRFEAAQRFKANMESLQRESSQQLLQHAGPEGSLSVPAQVTMMPLAGLTGEPLILDRVIQRWDGSTHREGEKIVLQREAGQPLHAMTAFEMLSCAAAIASAAAAKRVDIEEKGYLVKQAANVLDGTRPGVECDRSGKHAGQFPRGEPSAAMTRTIQAMALKTDRLIALSRTAHEQEARLDQIDKELELLNEPLPEPQILSPQEDDKTPPAKEPQTGSESVEQVQEQYQEREAKKRSIMEMALAAKQKAEAAQAKVEQLETEKHQLQAELEQKRSETEALEAEISEMEAGLLNPEGNP